MKKIKSKALMLGLSCFAFSATFAQDSPRTPKPDTTKAPRHDSTVMVKSHLDTSSPKTFNATTSFVMINDNKLAAKKEVVTDTKIV